MKSTISYKAKIIKNNEKIALRNTLLIYRNAVKFIANVVLENFETISTFEYKEQQAMFIESLIHTTKNNKALYEDFDKNFYKFPSYFRRDAIRQALGFVSSYMSNLKNYEEERNIAISNGLKFKKKKPTLNLNINVFPSFYKDNMYIPYEGNTIYLKLFKNNDWVFVPLELRTQDIKYIENVLNSFDSKIGNPSLVYSYGNFKLQYPIEVKYELKKEPKFKQIKNLKILAVDLGVNTDATCSVLNGDGTIVGRYFINSPIDKDRRTHLLNRKKKLQKQSGNYKYAPLKKIDTKLKGYDDNIANQTSHKILQIALKESCNIIVFENLSGNFKGSRSQKLNHWRKKAIIKKTCKKAHIYGIRYATVSPKDTSKLAFDGSGEVIRDSKNYSLCTFKNGKQYNCDLSASYNIGARYLLKLIQKTISEKKWSGVLAKVPELQKRTNITYSTLIKVLDIL